MGKHTGRLSETDRSRYTVCMRTNARWQMNSTTDCVLSALTSHLAPQLGNKGESSLSRTFIIGIIQIHDIFCVTTINLHALLDPCPHWALLFIVCSVGHTLVLRKPQKEAEGTCDWSVRGTMFPGPHACKSSFRTSRQYFQWGSDGVLWVDLFIADSQLYQKKPQTSSLKLISLRLGFPEDSASYVLVSRAHTISVIAPLHFPKYTYTDF